MIRSTLAMIGFAASVTVPAMALAQSETPTVEGYLCEFANRCGDAVVEEAEETMEAPETKGFRLARATNARTDTARLAPPAPAPRREQANNARLTPARTTPQTSSVAGAKADLVISFELNSAQLTTDGRRNAMVFAEALATPDLRSKRFQIAGHTDALGSREANLDLSQRRAQAVADLLVSQGIDRSRLEVTGYGEARPLAGRSAGDPANRRVEAVLR